MITIEQCRGARGILGWTQQDLADACGLSKTAINNFEKNHSDIKAESLRAIKMAFESSNIEFIGTQGVSKKTEDTRILRGPTAMNDLIEDITESIMRSKGEILIHNIDHSLTNRISTQTLFALIETLKNNNADSRIICAEGTTNILSPMDICRSIAPESANNGITTFIYGNKIAFELWDQSMITIIDSTDAHNAERDRFESLWNKAQIQAEKSTETKQASHTA